MSPKKKSPKSKRSKGAAKPKAKQASSRRAAKSRPKKASPKRAAKPKKKAAAKRVRAGASPSGEFDPLLDAAKSFAARLLR